MSQRKRLIWLGAISALALLAFGLAGCGPSATQPVDVTQPLEPTQPPQATETEVVAEPEGEKTSITLVIPEDPPSFNAIVGDTGYDALVMNLVMLGLTGVDPEGKVFLELAAELPTVENGRVTVDEEAGTMDVTWKLRQMCSGRTGHR
jgi:hypothetical protein